MVLSPDLGRFRKVYQRMWSDAGFRRLSPLKPSGQALFMYLLTGAETGILPGVVRIGVGALAESLDWSPEDTRGCLLELEHEGMVLSDSKARLIWLRNALKYNAPENPNVITGWKTPWAETPECNLKEVIWEALHSEAKQRGESFLSAFMRACPPSRDGLGNDSRDGLDNGYWNQEPEPEPEHEQKHEQKPEPKPYEGTGRWDGDFEWIPAFGWVEEDRGDSARDEVNLNGLETDEDWYTAMGLDQKSPPSADGNDRSVQDREAPSVAATSPAGSRINQIDDVSNAAVEEILNAWNSMVCEANPIFDPVTGAKARAIRPQIEVALKGTGTREDLLDLFKIIPIDPWYAGENKNGFFAFLGHYIKLGPEKLHAAADTARTKLRRRAAMSKGSASASKANVEGQKAREAMKAGERPPKVGNNLLARLAAKSKGNI